MKKICARTLAFAALLLAAGGTAGATPETNHYPRPVAGDMDGVPVVVETQPEQLLAGIQFFVPAGLDRQAAGKSGSAALTAECILESKVDGIPLRELIADGGGSISYSIEGGYAHFYLEGRSVRLPALLHAFAQALAAPDFESMSVNKARASLLRRLADAEGNPLQVGIQMFRQAFYAGSSIGLPSLGTSAGMRSLTPGDVHAFYNAAYRRPGSTLSVVGNVTPEINASLRELSRTLPAGPAAPIAQKVKGGLPAATRIVTYRDVGVPWLVLGFAAPAPGSPDFGAMLLIESLLSNGLERPRTTSAPAEDRAITTLYLDDLAPASFVVLVNGAGVDPSIALREVLVVTHSLATRPLAADAIKRLKTEAQGAYLTDYVTLADQSYALAKYATLRLGPDYLNTALDAIAAAAPADVQRVARRYLQKYTVAIVLPRESSSP